MLPKSSSLLDARDLKIPLLPSRTPNATAISHSFEFPTTLCQLPAAVSIIMARMKNTLASTAPSKVVVGSSSLTTSTVGAGASKSAVSVDTAYALLDKDVAQDVNLLTPDPSLASSDSPSTTHTIAEEKKKPTLMTLPNEIKQNIWKMVVVLDKDITPIQVGYNSNKFLWDSAQYSGSWGSHDVAAAAPLMVVNLSNVSKAMYEEVSLTHLFYRFNNFDFTLYPDHFKAYMIGITDARRQAIASMSFALNIGWAGDRRNGAESMTLIASCKGLESLKLGMHNHVHQSFNFNNYMASREYKHAYAAVEGLKNLSLFISTASDDEDPGNLKLKASFETFKNDMAATMAKPRSGVYNLKLFQQAQETASLDIHGEGRLSEDKKPGIISSRTRARKARDIAISADGIRPRRDTPKYDLDGFLAWHIESVLESRMSSGEDGSTGVEFQLKCLVRDNPTSQQNRTVICWEDASVVGPIYRDRIVQFYKSNPNEPGLLAVYNEWAHYIDGEDENPIWRWKQMKDLEAIKTRLARAREAEVEAMRKAVMEDRAKAIAKALVKASAKAGAKTARARGKK
ncbi:hypothetical protein BKA65DRAFT_512727 [Rhexocercosporidium sp. MPI-PUGE-AT-0058]|nr:hypothetical protein BKA65DRAFT_512727 [Rhexocercosporidium sp. MPI-PUGE-AT-0058]